MQQLIEQFIQRTDADMEAVSKHNNRAYLDSKSVLRRMGRIIGSTDNCTEKAMADFFRSLPISEQRARRKLLCSFTSYAMIEGALSLTHNVFKSTGDCFAGYKPTPAKKRQRITLEQFNAIYAIAPPHLQNAMELSLLTGFRRGDVCDLQFKHIEDGFIRKVILKSEAKMGVQGSHKQINLRDNKPLLSVVNRCQEARQEATHLIHAPNHPAISPQKLSELFQRYRDKCGLFNDVPPENRPTFHEIRALHVHIRIKAGDQMELVQYDAAHQDIAMTKHYSEGHETEWQPLNISPAIERALDGVRNESKSLTIAGPRVGNKT